MSEPEDLTPLPEDPPTKADAGNPKLSRSPYVALGVAALVVSTVFATVAALSATRDTAAPAPESKGKVETSTPETYTTDPGTSSSPDDHKKHSRHGSDPSSSTSSKAGTSSSENGETTSGTGGDTTTAPGHSSTSQPPSTTTTTPNKSPIADFSFDCTGLKCDFDAGTSTDPDGTITSYSWSFGASGETASHTFDQAGSFEITLTVIDNDGKNATQKKSVTVSTPPTTSGN
jgi:PKD repeat protein